MKEIALKANRVARVISLGICLALLVGCTCIVGVNINFRFSRQVIYASTLYSLYSNSGSGWNRIATLTDDANRGFSRQQMTSVNDDLYMVYSNGSGDAYLGVLSDGSWSRYDIAGQLGGDRWWCIATDGQRVFIGGEGAAGQSGLAEFRNGKFVYVDTADIEDPISLHWVMAMGAHRGKLFAAGQSSVATLVAGKWETIIDIGDIAPWPMGLATDICGDGETLLVSASLPSTGGIIAKEGSTISFYNPLNSDIPFDAISCLDFADGIVYMVGMRVELPGGILSGMQGFAVWDGTTVTYYDTENSDMPSDAISDLSVSRGIVHMAASKGYCAFDGTSWVSHEFNEPAHPTYNQAVSVLALTVSMSPED